MKMPKIFFLPFILLLVALPSLCLAAPGSWRQIGPDQQGSGYVTTLAFDPRRPSRAFAGIGDGGIARSGDGGRTWQMMNEGLTSQRVSSVVVHPALGRLVYAIAGGAAHRSLNDGRSWSRLPLAEVFVVAPDPRDPAGVWAGTRHGLFQSHDAGITWERNHNLPPGADVRSLAVDSQDPRRLYAGLYAYAARRFGFWVTEDGGRSWKRRSAEVPSSLQADPHVAGTVYVQAEGVLFRSRDAGRTLQRFFTLLASPITGTLALDPRDASTAFVVGLQPGAAEPSLFRTTDAGRSWLPFAADLHSDLLPPPSLAVSSEGHVLLGTAQGVIRSPASVPSWTPANRGLIRSLVISFATGRAGALFVHGYKADVLRSLDGGATWTVSLSPGTDVGTVAAAPGEPGTLYFSSALPVGEEPRLLWKTTDNGDTWNALPYPLRDPTIWLGVQDLAVDPSDPQTVFLAADVSSGAQSGLLRSRDGGRSWDSIGLPGSYLQVEIDPEHPERIFALFSYTSLQRSLDGGETWQTVLEPPNPLYRFAIAPSDPDVLYAVQADGTLRRSSDGGATFVSLGKRLPALLRGLAVDPRDPDTFVFSGGAGAVRMVLGSGKERLGPSFFMQDLYGLLFDPQDPLRLLAGTGGAGLLEYRFGS